MAGEGVALARIVFWHRLFAQKVARAAARVLYFGVRVKHHVSRDISETVRRWFGSQFQDEPPDYIFDSATACPTTLAFDAIECRRRHIPPVDVLHLVFSCKEVSHWNVNRKASPSCVRSAR